MNQIVTPNFFASDNCLVAMLPIQGYLIHLLVAQSEIFWSLDARKQP